ncbi:flavin reductase family protein [Cupriavidus basilensis]
MYVDLQALDGAERHKVLSTVVVPRPIAWISSMDEHGAVNVAPFSFFNLLSADPPLFCVGIGARDAMPKDTARNIRTRGEFTVNMVSAALARRMNVTAIEFPAGVNEAQEAGLVLAPGVEVATPRIAQSPASLRVPRAAIARCRRAAHPGGGRYRGDARDGRSRARPRPALPGHAPHGPGGPAAQPRLVLPYRPGLPDAPTEPAAVGWAQAGRAGRALSCRRRPSARPYFPY